MPFRSQAQRGYLFVHEPEVAKKFAAETPKGAKLPQHVDEDPYRPANRKYAGQKRKRKTSRTGI